MKTNLFVLFFLSVALPGIAAETIIVLPPADKAPPRDASPAPPDVPLAGDVRGRPPTGNRTAAPGEDLGSARQGAPRGTNGGDGSARTGTSAAGVPYLSGGVGLEERQRLEQSTGDYNLKLVFAATAGAYLGDVHVVIRGPRGVALDATSTGPWFFAKLPPGKYRVSATANGRTQTKSVSVGGKQSRAAFYFPGES